MTREELVEALDQRALVTIAQLVDFTVEIDPSRAGVAHRAAFDWLAYRQQERVMDVTVWQQLGGQHD